jgi:hypothetical protein
MESKFRPLYRNEVARPLIVHFTCATYVSSSFPLTVLLLVLTRTNVCSDTEQLKIVFGAVEESILKAAMEDIVRPLTFPPPLRVTLTLPLHRESSEQCSDLAKWYSSISRPQFFPSYAYPLSLFMHPVVLFPPPLS